MRTHSVKATWCDMCCACAPKPRWHASYMMAFSCYETSFIIQRGPVGFLSLPGLLWSTWSSVMSAIWGSLCHGGGQRRGKAARCSSSSNPFILGCLDPELPVILKRKRDRKLDSKVKRKKEEGGQTDGHTVPGRAESIKAHQIKNSCTLKVTNTGEGGQSCQQPWQSLSFIIITRTVIIFLSLSLFYSSFYLWHPDEGKTQKLCKHTLAWWSQRTCP